MVKLTSVGARVAGGAADWGSSPQPASPTNRSKAVTTGQIWSFNPDRTADAGSVSTASRTAWPLR